MPFTPEPARPVKFVAPKLLLVPYVVKLTLMPPRLVLLGMVVAELLVRGKYNKLTCAACPTVAETKQPARATAQTKIDRDNFAQLNLDETGGQAVGSFVFFIVVGSGLDLCWIGREILLVTNYFTCFLSG